MRFKGFCPSLCVFGIVCKIIRASPTPCQVEHANIIEKAMRELEQHKVKRKVSFAMKYRDPHGGECNDLRSLSNGSPVLVYRDRLKSWKGTFKFIHINGDTAFVQLPYGRTLFQSCLINLFVETSDTLNVRMCRNDTGKR